MHSDQATLAELADGSASRPSMTMDRLCRGQVVGRYVILDELGAGGMGIVYAAYDPELDRKIAIKLLRPGLGSRGSDGEVRLLREAQALARLSHPNVVAIHDVGTRGDDVWLAMEYVDGRTLTAFLAQRPHRWHQVLTVLRPVALGLSAAHAADLVHRDIKPDNIMLGNDGRVRVMDFGLARGSVPVERVEARASGGSDPFAKIVTGLGATPGTPAYMAPEQFAGERTDGRADQFAYCVVLWEALFGERPFEGTSFLDLATNVLESRRRAPPRGIAVPRWLRVAIERGLSADPEARWPSMIAFLDALDRGRRRSRATKAIVGLAALASTGAAVLGARHLEERRRIAACEQTGAAIEDVWSEGTHRSLRDLLLASGATHAETTVDKLKPWLDDYATTWKHARTDACLRHDVYHEWDDDTLDRAASCLDERRFELATLVEQLLRADATAVQRAVPAAANLRLVSPCADVDFLQRLPPVPSELREHVVAVRRDLARARAMQMLGTYEESKAAAHDALDAARAAGWPPLIAAARVQLAVLLERTGDYETAQSMLETAYFEAAISGAREEALRAAEGLTFTLGARRKDHEGALRWARHAEVLLSVLPDPTGLRAADHAGHLGAVYYSRGEYAEAATHVERALALREDVLGPTHPIVATTMSNLALLREELGSPEVAAALHERALSIRSEVLGPGHPELAQSLVNLGNLRLKSRALPEAAALYARALAIQEEALGPEHPDVAACLDGYAGVLQAKGDLAAATTHHERALAIREARHGPEHRDVAISLDNLAVTAQQGGDYERARDLYGRALAIRERTLGNEHPLTASSLNHLGILMHLNGAYEEASELHERALAIFEKALGPDHPSVGNTLVRLADVRRSTGAYVEAEELYRRSLKILEEKLGSDHPELAHACLGAGELALVRGQAGQARAQAERAVELRSKANVRAVDLAEAQFLLARAMSSAGRPEPDAIALAEEAATSIRAAGNDRSELLTEIEKWLLQANSGKRAGE